MPWTPADARTHTHLVHDSDSAEARQWAHVANGVLKETGSEARAIREANEVIRKRHEDT